MFKNNTQNVKTAKEDIHCYKVLRIKNTHLISPYQKYRYYLNKLVTVDKMIHNNFGNVYEGLHAYTTKLKALNCIIWMARVLGWGHDNYKVYNCIIPKGSKYYLGNNGDIVSNQMIITGRYKDKD